MVTPDDRKSRWSTLITGDDEVGERARGEVYRPLKTGPALEPFPTV